MARRKFFLTPDERALLKKARRLVTETHWVKQSYCRADATVPGKECYCLAGLVNHVLDREPGSGSSIGTTKEQLEKEARFFVEVKEDRAWHPADLVRKKLFYAVASAIRKSNPRSRTTSIESWNDRILTTREDVIHILDLALETEAL